MKTQSEIKQKLKQVQFRHAKKEIEQLLAIEPVNCAYNRKLELSGFGQIGFCASETCPRKGKSCDTRLGDLATSCGHYAPLLDADAARTRAKHFFASAHPGEIARMYPDVAALLWTLDDTPVESHDPYLVGTWAGHSIWASSVVGADAVRTELDALTALAESKSGDDLGGDSESESESEDSQDAGYDDSEVRSDIARLMLDFSVLSKSVHAASSIGNSPPGNRLLGIFLGIFRPMAITIGAFVGRLGKS